MLHMQGVPMAPSPMPMYNPQYAPMSDQMPMDNNIPSVMSGEEDCGCDEPRTLFSPQPGAPYYPNYSYHPMPQSSYPPQPGAMYYPQDPPVLFGTPYSEEGE